MFKVGAVLAGRRFLLLGAIVLLVFSAAAADETTIDAIAARVGLETVLRKRPDGSEYKELVLPSGVVFRERRGGDRVEMIAVDNSGKGAVGCAWRIYAALAAGLEVCGGPSDEGLKRELGEALEAINDSIAVYDLTPTTKAEVDRDMRAHMLADRTRILGQANDQAERACSSWEGAAMLQRLRDLPPGAFKKSIDELLSVPRPPVMNPCL